jgi:phospholipase/carboxylesterase
MQNPLLDMPAVPFGAELHPSSTVVLLIHGRGQSPGDMIHIAQRMALPDVAYLALPAWQSSWYPESFMAPIEANQPHLGFALEQIERQVRDLEAIGCRRDRIALVGFSQGACLASEYVLRHPGRWGALIAFTGGLLGPEGTTWDDLGSLDRTPVLLSSSDADPWVPWARVEAAARVFERMNGDVTLSQFPGRDHLVCQAEIAAARDILTVCAAENRVFV